MDLDWIQNLPRANWEILCQRPFVDRAEHLTEDVVCVFPAADNLEHYIMSVMSSVVGDGGVEDICRQKITPYQVEY